MHLDRLRLGETVTAIGAIGLFASLFFDWVRPSGTVLRDRGAELPGALSDIANRNVGAFVDRLAQSGFSGLGIVLVVALMIAVLAGAALVVLTVSVEPVGLTIGTAITTTAVGIVTTIALLIRLTLAQPDLGLGYSDAQVDLLAPAYVGLACCAAIAAGGWLTIRDERTDAPYSAAPELPARPLPPLSPL